MIEELNHNPNKQINWHCGNCGKIFKAKAGRNPELHSIPIDDNSIIGFGNKLLHKIRNAKNPQCPKCGSKTVYNDWNVRRQ